MVQKIEIKNRWTGEVIFSHECEDNSIAKTVKETLMGDANLGDANLRGADLRDAYLGGANLRGADLGDANLGGAYLGGANLRGADLRDAYLGGANLRGADLRGADLRDAYLGGAYLGGAYLGGANLGGANLGGANLGGANYNECTAFFALQCPEEGDFIAWKKVKTCIVKLLIPADAQRSSATSRKCRASKAHVLAIYDKDGNEKKSVVSDNYVTTTYKVGENVLPDSWDDDRWNECSHGIHFFITRQEAELYN